jgi:osmoprotectant transport system permease protein
MFSLFEYFVNNATALGNQTLQHIGLTLISVVLAICMGVPLGIWCGQSKKTAPYILGVAGVLQTIPSMALLGFMIPVLGIGATPAIVALFLYALLPIIRNTYTGIREVDPAVREAALGLGLSRRGVLLQVEIPLALPVIFAGIRTATVINVGVATLAALIASGGLGESIFGGIALNNTQMILAGAIPAALLAVLLDFLLARLQQVNIRNLRLRILPFFLLLLLSVASLLLFSSFRSSFQAGFTPEFLGMSEGYPGLQKTYGLQLDTKVIQSGLMYDALHTGAVDIISGYSTDGRIREYKLTTLVDDRKHFPAYECGITIRQETLRQHPELESVLQKLSGKLSDQAMIDLNYKVDVLKQSPAQVAREFLDSLGLLKVPAVVTQGEVRIGSKIFTEQYILAEMIALLIEGHTSLKAAIKTGLGGTQICFEALSTGAIDLYPEYSGTGLEVILKKKNILQDSLQNDQAKVYAYINEQYGQQFQLRWLAPLGFSNTYALLMQAAEAKKMQIRTISDLKRFTARRRDEKQE